MQYVAEIVSAIADAPLRSRDLEAAIEVLVCLEYQDLHLRLLSGHGHQVILDRLNATVLLVCRSAPSCINDMQILLRTLLLPSPKTSLPKVILAFSIDSKVIIRIAKHTLCEQAAIVISARSTRAWQNLGTNRLCSIEHLLELFSIYGSRCALQKLVFICHAYMTSVLCRRGTKILLSIDAPG